MRYRYVKAKCKERDKPSDNNEHNIPSTSSDNDTAAFQTIEHLWSQTGNTISSNTIDIIYDKVGFWRKHFFLLPSSSCGKRDILKKQLSCYMNGFIILR